MTFRQMAYFFLKNKAVSQYRITNNCEVTSICIPQYNLSESLEDWLIDDIVQDNQFCY